MCYAVFMTQPTKCQTAKTRNWIGTLTGVIIHAEHGETNCGPCGWAAATHAK